MRANKGNAKLVKEVNRRLIFQFIRREHAVSRADIARSLGLSPTTVSALIDELSTEGFVRKLGCGTSRRGRRPVIYQIDPTARYAVGADVGSNVLTVITTDLNGTVIKESETSINDQVGQDLIRTLYEEINRCIQIAQIDRSRILGVGIASPGLIDYQGGTVIRAVNVEWEGVPLKGILEHELDLPVYVENMNNAAALGEYSWGIDRDVKRFFYLNVGRGVGGGIIADGRVLQGSGISAGEIGHLVIDRYGDKCRCGARGCLETLVSANALEKQAYRMADRFPNSSIVKLSRGEPKNITLEMLSQAAEDNDPLAVNVFTQAGEWLGFVIAGMINIFNPDVVMLGGRVIRAAEDMILAKARSIARENSFHALFDMVAFITPRLGHLSSALGAVSFVLQEKFEKPLIAFGDFDMHRLEKV